MKKIVLSFLLLMFYSPLFCMVQTPNIHLTAEDEQTIADETIADDVTSVLVDYDFECMQEDDEMLQPGMLVPDVYNIDSDESIHGGETRKRAWSEEDREWSPDDQDEEPDDEFAEADDEYIEERLSDTEYVPLQRKKKRNTGPKLHLRRAIRENKIHIVSSLLETVDPSIPYHGVSLMHHAIRSGHVRMVETLLERGITCCEMKNKAGLTPLFYAIARTARMTGTKGKQKETLAMIEHLIKYGVDYLSKADDIALTPCDFAIEKKAWDAALLLMAYGAGAHSEKEPTKVEIKKIPAAQIFMFFKKNKQVKICSPLSCSKGCENLGFDVHPFYFRRSDDIAALLNTGLRNAVKNGNMSYAKLFFACGGSLEASDEHGKNALTYAQEKNWRCMITLLATFKKMAESRERHPAVMALSQRTPMVFVNEYASVSPVMGPNLGRMHIPVAANNVPARPVPPIAPSGELSSVAQSAIKPAALAAPVMKPAPRKQQLDLLRAAAEGNIEKLQEYIRSGKNPARLFYTPVGVALANRNTEIIPALIKRGASVDAMNKNETLLHLALRQDKTNDVLLLIQMGASLNLKNNQGKTPLMMASAKNNIHVLNALLLRGAKRDIVCNGKTFIDFLDEDLKAFVLNKHEDSQDVQEIELNGTAAGKKRALQVVQLLSAAASGDIEKVRSLLKNRASMVVCPLLLASCTGNLTTMKLLLDKGAHVDTSYPEHAGPLSQAIASGNTSAALLLIERGADCNALGKGMTPLMLAAREGDFKVLNALRAKGAREDLKNSEGKTFHDCFEPIFKRFFDLLAQKTPAQKVVIEL